MSHIRERPFAGYDDGEGGTMLFFRSCPACRRFVKRDTSVAVGGLGEHMSQPNATCSRCGWVEMDFQGFFGPDEVSHTP